MQFAVASEIFATSCLAYLMYNSCKCVEVIETMNKKFYKNAIKYVLGLLLLCIIFVVGYDFGTGTYNHTILPNGHCVYLFQPQYTTLRLLDAYAYVNGIIQVLLLVAY